LILRVYTTCPGCDAPTVLRIGVAVPPGEKQPFTVHCPKCSSTIRGQLNTTKDYQVSARLDEAPIVPEDSSEDWQIITTHPAFPFVPGEESSPFIQIEAVLGDAAFPYFRSVGGFNGTVDQEWPQLERAFQFYLNEDWSRFDKAMSRLLEEGWPDNPDMVQRHDIINRLLQVVILPLDRHGLYRDMQREVWGRAQPSRELLTHLRQQSVQADLLALQKRLFRQVAHMIEIRQMWLPVVPFLWLNRLGRSAPEEWRLPGDDFAILRGSYQQNFELSCQALPLLVATQNSADGRDAVNIRLDSDPSPWIPSTLPKSARPPQNLAQFGKLSSEAKEAFLDRFPVTEAGWVDAFDRRIRNAIAHADADAVIATGEIATSKGDALSYLTFVESIVKQLQLLVLWLNLAKLFRVYDVMAGRK
jgi:hypothetical protein